MKWWRRLRARFQREAAPVLLIPEEVVYPDSSLFMDGETIAKLRTGSWPLKDKTGVAAAQYFGCTFPNQATRDIVVRLHQKLLTHDSLKRTNYGKPV